VNEKRKRKEANEENENGRKLLPEWMKHDAIVDGSWRGKFRRNVVRAFRE